MLAPSWGKPATARYGGLFSENLLKKAAVSAIMIE
jgi:hypothetical protein